MTLTRLDQPVLVTDRVFDALREAITGGAIPPGSRLRLRELATQLGTSAMPVREAIGRLEQTGLVVRVPHRGAVVVELTPEELLDVYDARLLLEVEAARRGVMAVDGDGIARMRVLSRLLTNAVTERRSVDALEHDEALLTVLYDASGSPVLAGLIADLWRRCRPYKLLGAAADQLARGSWTHQAALIDAAEAREPDRAADLTRGSLVEARERIEDLLRR